jgi:6-phosphogluconolactonase
MTDVELRIVETAEEAGETAAGLIAEAAGADGHIGLSGGSGPRPAYERAAILRPDWGRVELWWIDDRCVPPADGRSNYRTVRESLLDGLAREPAEVHRIRGELEPEEAAAEYDAALEGVTLDLAVMGIGPDGHTASLFPNEPSLDATAVRAVAAPAQLEPWVDRVTMTVPMLCSAREVVFLVVGAEKAEAARRAFVEPPSRATPASLVRSSTGRTVAILDPAAAALVR